MNTPEPQAAVREAIRHWSRLPELAEFARCRHGFGDNDSGFGINYPGDLDDYDREADGVSIPEGWVQVYGFWGSPDGYELLLPEPVYLEVLAGMLSEAEHLTEAAQVRSLFAG